MLRVYTLGGLRIERDGQLLQLPTQKTRDLLAYLITFRDRPHPRPVLAGTLWPDLSEEKARRRLSDTLWRVRRILGNHVLADDECIWFNADLPYWLDVEQFQAATDLTLETSNRESPENALDLYRGPFLDGLYHDWVLLGRERLRELYLGTLAHLLERHKQTGDYAAALSIAQCLVTAEPLHEAGYRELMRLYHLLDRDAEAIAQYHRCRAILQEELNVAPAPETEVLYQELSLRTVTLPGASTPHLPAPARRPDIDLGQLPLVGRDTERSALLNHLEAAAAGQGGIVLVEGEPGIGKTRLAQELISGARWRDIEATLVNASEVATAPYAVLVAALTAVLTPLRVRQLTRLIDPVHIQATVPLLPYVAQDLPDLPPLPNLPPAEARQRLQGAFIALILGLARLSPHLWVLEDLQWADAETLSLLTLLCPHLTECRVLLLLTGRSTELRANPVAWEALQTLDRVAPLPRYTLTRLDVNAIGCLVRYLLNEDNPALTDCLARESAGVPLYVVETFKAWRDEAYLLPDERGGWRWREGAPTATPPHLGEAVIGHRLSLLSPAAEELLAAAAIVGTEVDFDLLAYVCALPGSAPNVAGPDGYLLATDDLLRLGFLAETETGYRFSHEQVRRTVYHRLPPKQCQDLHRRVAQALEALYPEQFELPAHHFAAAGEREPAIHYLTRAAERSRELFAHQSTLAIYDRLLSLLAHTEDREARYGVLSDRAEVLRWVGDREAEGRDLEEMLGLTNALSDDCRLAGTLRRRSEWHRLQGQYELANEDAQSALDIYRRLGDEREQAVLLTQLGWNIVFTPALSQAAHYFQEALPIHEALGDVLGQMECLSGLVAAAKMEGDYARTLFYLRKHIALAETTGEPLRIGRALGNAGVIHFTLGDMEAAATYLRKALQFKETAGDRRSTAITHLYQGLMDAECGELETAQDHLTTALEALREVHDRPGQGDALAALGRLAFDRGDFVTANDLLQAAYQCHREVGEAPGAVGDLSCWALAELALGDGAAAWQHSQAAIGELEGDQLEVEHSQWIYYNHFRLTQATHRWAEARAALEKAVHILEKQVERIGVPALQETYRTGRRFNRGITEALANLPPSGCLRVELARVDVPAHRPPTPRETATLVWTVDAGEPDAALAERDGKVALRRHRILRLLAEAEEAGGSPTVADLAGALDVSPRTIDSDLAALRGQGHPVRTRGHRA